MRTFSCFITDDRYSVPTLAFLIADDERRARQLARQRLMDSPHHLRIELLEDGRPVYSQHRQAQGRGRPPVI